MHPEFETSTKTLAYLLLVPGGLMAAIAFVCWRADSFFVALDRIWRLAAGSRGNVDKELENRIDEIRSVSRFRVIFGIKVRSRKALERLFGWLDGNGLDIVDAQNCRHNIRADKPEILCVPTNA